MPKYEDGVKALLAQCPYPRGMTLLLSVYIKKARKHVYARFAGMTPWRLEDIYPVREFLEIHGVKATTREVLDRMLIDNRRRSGGGE